MNVYIAIKIIVISVKIFPNQFVITNLMHICFIS
jgi:hypothetical protein